MDVEEALRLSSALGFDTHRTNFCNNQQNPVFCYKGNDLYDLAAKLDTEECEDGFGDWVLDQKEKLNLNKFLIGTLAIHLQEKSLDL